MYAREWVYPSTKTLIDTERVWKRMHKNQFIQLPVYPPQNSRTKLGKCKALWGKPRTLLRLSQRSTELSCTRFDAERWKKSKAIDEQRCGTVFFFAWTHQPTHEFRLLYEFQVVAVCEVHTLAGMPGLVIVLDPACACQWERRRTVKKGWNNSTVVRS